MRIVPDLSFSFLFPGELSEDLLLFGRRGSRVMSAADHTAPATPRPCLGPWPLGASAGWPLPALLLRWGGPGFSSG